MSAYPCLHNARCKSRPLALTDRELHRCCCVPFRTVLSLRRCKALAVFGTRSQQTLRTQPPTF